MFYAYVYRDTRPHKNNEPIYVGKGCKNRSSFHMDGSHNFHLASKINKMKAHGLEPAVEVINVARKRRLKHEQRWLKHIVSVTLYEN